ncbi:hypothetical protein GGG16DRAFT_102947 [Schizophyllum commune]
MRFDILAALFSAFVGLSAATVLESRQLAACPPGRKTWCSGKECLDSGCEGCTDVGTDYAPGTCDGGEAWACIKDYIPWQATSHCISDSRPLRRGSTFYPADYFHTLHYFDTSSVE